MRTIIQQSTMLLGASMFTLAQADVHAHARAKVHDVVRPLDMLNIKRGTPMLETRGEDEDYYGGKKHESSGSGGKGGEYGKDGSYEYEEYGSQNSGSSYGDGYGDQNSDDSTTTIIVNVTEEGSYGMGKETAMDETMTLSVYNSYQGAQTSVQLSLVTTTVYESSPPQTVTVMSMAQPVTQTEMVTITMADTQTEMVTVTESDTQTQMITVTEADTQTEMVTITQADIQTQMVTVTEPGTCSTTGLATADVGALSQSYAMTTASYYASVSDSSILTAAAPSITYTSVGYSGQVAQGTGIYNGAGSCDCACACAADSFPTYAAMAASPTAAAPTTMQTVASSAAGESAVYSNSYAAPTTSGYSNTTSSYAEATIDSSSSSDGSSTSSINVVFTLNSYTSSSTYVTSSPPESTTSSYSSSDTPAAGTSTSASAQADLASDPTYTTSAPSQAAPSGLSINLSTLSLSSELVLGNLAAQATPGA